MYLNLWGEKDSRPYLQSFHFAFGIGAVLAPIIGIFFNDFLKVFVFLNKVNKRMSYLYI